MHLIMLPIGRLTEEPAPVGQGDNRMPSYLHKDTGAEPTRPKRQLRLRRVPILLLLVLLATSCNRARTAGLMAPGAPAFAYREMSVELPGSKPDVRIEGYYTRPSPAGTYPCAVILHGKGGWWRAYIPILRPIRSNYPWAIL
jgi:hypothetical protein